RERSLPIFQPRGGGGRGRWAGVAISQRLAPTQGNAIQKGAIRDRTYTSTPTTTTATVVAVAYLHQRIPTGAWAMQATHGRDFNQVGANTKRFYSSGHPGSFVVDDIKLTEEQHQHIKPHRRRPCPRSSTSWSPALPRSY
ncbi:unnamed protein product, partial [Ectocarpus fasciculatus]